MGSAVGAAGLPDALFEGMAQAYEALVARAGDSAPEQVPVDVTWAEVLTALG